MYTILFHSALSWISSSVVKFVSHHSFYNIITPAVFIACSLAQQWVVVESIDFFAKYVYTNTPYLNDSKRPQSIRPSRYEGWGVFILRTYVPATLINYTSINLWKSASTIAREYSSFSTWQWCGYYIWLGSSIQTSLILADVFYGAWHHLQHTVPCIYRVSDHKYHHQFRYPLAREGTFLGIVDVSVSGFLILYLNIYLTTKLMGPLNIFEIMIMTSYIHEMNGCDHCGKVMTFHSGTPFFPFLSKLCGFDKSVEAHEAHHNLNKYSYGLLGFYDMIMGTRIYSSK